MAQAARIRSDYDRSQETRNAQSGELQQEAGELFAAMGGDGFIYPPGERPDFIAGGGQGATLSAEKIRNAARISSDYGQASSTPGEFMSGDLPNTKEAIASMAETIMQMRQITKYGGKAYIGALPLDLADLVERYAQAGRERIEAMRTVVTIERDVATRRATLTVDPWVQGGKNESVRDANLAIMMGTDADFQSMLQALDEARFHVEEWQHELNTAQQRIAITRAWLTSQNMSV
jgi:hypothetical protein